MRNETFETKIQYCRLCKLLFLLILVLFTSYYTCTDAYADFLCPHPVNFNDANEPNETAISNGRDEHKNVSSLPSYKRISGDSHEFTHRCSAKNNPTNQVTSQIPSIKINIVQNYPPVSSDLSPPVS